MTKGYQVQMKQVVLDLKKKHKTGAHMFRIQGSIEGLLKITYRTLGKVDKDDIHEFGKDNAEQAFQELTECVHYLNSNKQ